MRTAAWILAAIVGVIAAGFFVFMLIAAVREASEVADEEGVMAATTAAVLWTATGALAAAVIGSPAIVAWRRRRALAMTRRAGRVAGASAVAALVAVAGIAAFATSNDAQAPIALIYPFAVSSLCAADISNVLRGDATRLD